MRWQGGVGWGGGGILLLFRFMVSTGASGKTQTAFFFLVYFLFIRSADASGYYAGGGHSK